jgi:hypothetical protein
MSYNILHFYWTDLVKILERIIKLMLAGVFTMIGSAQKKKRGSDRARWTACVLPVSGRVRHVYVFYFFFSFQFSDYSLFFKIKIGSILTGHVHINQTIYLYVRNT